MELTEFFGLETMVAPLVQQRSNSNDAEDNHNEYETESEGSKFKTRG